jgi:hypothetical protein
MALESSEPLTMEEENAWHAAITEANSNPDLDLYLENDPAVAHTWNMLLKLNGRPGHRETEEESQKAMALYRRMRREEVAAYKRWMRNAQTQRPQQRIAAPIKITPIEQFVVDIRDGWMRSYHIGQWITNKYILMKTEFVNAQALTVLKSMSWVSRKNMDDICERLSSSKNKAPKFQASVMGIAAIDGLEYAVISDGKLIFVSSARIFCTFLSLVPACDLWVTADEKSVVAVRNGGPVGWVSFAEPDQNIIVRIAEVLGFSLSVEPAQFKQLTLF